MNFLKTDRYIKVSGVTGLVIGIGVFSYLIHLDKMSYIFISVKLLSLKPALLLSILMFSIDVQQDRSCILFTWFPFLNEIKPCLILIALLTFFLCFLNTYLCIDAIMSNGRKI